MSNMIGRLFVEHPQSVNETYLQHLATAMGFALKLLSAGVVCTVHAVVPCLFEKTASEAIGELHDRMVVNRVRREALRNGEAVEHA
ncbi:MAG: DUF6356 family protein [Proteobacteria bacterium]|nr:DUF6356 family protein [Pseudomonadota bacterium]